MSSLKSFRWILVSCMTTMSASNVSNMAYNTSVRVDILGRPQPLALCYLEGTVFPPWLVSKGIPYAIDCRDVNVEHGRGQQRLGRHRRTIPSGDSERHLDVYSDLTETQRIRNRLFRYGLLEKKKESFRSSTRRRRFSIRSREFIEEGFNTWAQKQAELMLHVTKDISHQPPFP